MIHHFRKFSIPNKKIIAVAAMSKLSKQEIKPTLKELNQFIVIPNIRKFT